MGSAAPALAPEPAIESTPITLLNVTVISSMGQLANASVGLDIEGRHDTRQAQGVGGVDAIYKALCMLVPHEAKFLISHVENAKQSQGSEGVAHVRTEFDLDGQTIVGEGKDLDTYIATARAFVDALNQVRCFGKGSPH